MKTGRITTSGKSRKEEQRQLEGEEDALGSTRGRIKQKRSGVEKEEERGSEKERDKGEG
jgi:hypothetical protein